MTVFAARHRCRDITEGPRTRRAAAGRASMAANAATDAAVVTVAARLDRLPPSRHMRRLITLLSLGAWFEFYDLFFPAYVAIGLFKEGLFKPTTSGLFDLQGFASLIASGFAGMFVGTLAFSWLSTASAAARSSPSRCSGIRSAPSSWRFRRRRRPSISGASSPASGSASNSSMSTPICRSWCRRNSAARLSRSTRASCTRRCR